MEFEENVKYFHILSESVDGKLEKINARASDLGDKAEVAEVAAAAAAQQKLVCLHVSRAPFPVSITRGCQFYQN